MGLALALAALAAAEGEDEALATEDEALAAEGEDEALGLVEGGGEGLLWSSRGERKLKLN